MKTNRWPRIILLILLLLVLVPPCPTPVRAGASRFYGVLHYTERGPGASGDGLATAMLAPLAGGVAAARLTTGLSPLLKVAMSMSKDPTIQEVNNLLIQGVPIDMAAILPISSAYSADIEFTLLEGKDGHFTLEQGSLKWTNSNSTSFEYANGTIVDRFSGSGTHTLDPAKDTITLTFIKGTPPMYELEVNITHPTPTSGNSTWNAMGGAFSMWIQSSDGHQVMGGQMLGEVFPEAPMGGGIPSHGIYYVRQAPMSELSGMETWRNLLDAQIMARYEITDSCIVRIANPIEYDRVVFSSDSVGVLEGQMEAEIIPRAYANALSWSIEEIAGSTLTYEPEDARGRIVTFRYEGLPERNHVFGWKVIRVHVDTSIAPGCEAPEFISVMVLFPRDASNNPDGNVPNWFYYWRQTSAAQGRGDRLGYDPACTHAYGYYAGLNDPVRAEYIYICRGMQTAMDFRDYNIVTKRRTEGIDVFAVTVTHEWTHLTDFRDWWGQPPTYDAARDKDGDLVPDDREAGYGLDPNLKDTHGNLGRDCELTALRSENNWRVGTANGEDFAHPGKRSGGR